MNKKSQVTIYIMLGVVLIMLISLIVYFNNQQKILDINQDLIDGSDAKILESVTKTSSPIALSDGIYDHGLDQESLRAYVSNVVKNDLDSTIKEIEDIGVDVEKGPYAFDLEVTDLSIIIKGTYEIKMQNGDEVDTWKDFEFTLPLLVTYELDLDDDCKTKEDLYYYSSDKLAKIHIPVNTVVKDGNGNCLREFGIRASPNTAPLSVFTVSYDFLPNGATFDPYFEMEMYYNQDEFERVRSIYSSYGYNFKEENIKVGYYDSEGDIYRPYDDHPQTVDTVENIVYAKPTHFTWLFALTGCEGSETVKYYHARIQTPPAEENPQFTPNSGMKECEKFLCEDVTRTDSIQWNVRARAACHNKKNSVQINTVISEGDNLDQVAMGGGGETVASVTTAGTHEVPIQITDGDGCGEPDGGSICAYADVYIRVEGVGFKTLGKMLKPYTPTGEEFFESRTYSIDGEPIKAVNLPKWLPSPDAPDSKAAGANNQLPGGTIPPTTHFGGSSGGGHSGGGGYHGSSGGGSGGSSSSSSTGSIREAGGSDNWPTTWGERDGEDVVYTSWGDGGGFGGSNSDGRVSLGFGIIKGDPGGLEFRNIFGGANGVCGSNIDGKSYAILYIDGKFYSFITPGSGAKGYSEARLYISDDGACSFDRTDVVFTPSNHDIIKPSFLQFGKNYEGNTDGYVYMYAVHPQNTGDLAIQKPGILYLLRVPKDSIGSQGAYEFFSGTATEPAWSGDAGSKVAVHESDLGFGWAPPAVSWHPEHELYYMTTDHHDGGGEPLSGSGMGVYKAVEPWGPWEEVAIFSEFDQEPTFFYNIPTKWMNGENMYMVYSGTGDNDAFLMRPMKITEEGVEWSHGGGSGGEGGGEGGVTYHDNGCVATCTEMDQCASNKNLKCGEKFRCYNGNCVQCDPAKNYGGGPGGITINNDCSQTTRGKNRKCGDDYMCHTVN